MTDFSKVGILLSNEWIHPKNLEALQLSCKKLNIPLHTISSLDEANKYESPIIFAPAGDINRFPLDKIPKNKFIIYGPHAFVFPNNNWIGKIEISNAIYILPSQWTVDFWNEFCEFKIPVVVAPFCVNIDLYIPNKSINERDHNYIIYEKSRSPQEYQYIQNIIVPFLSNKGYTPIRFNYQSKYIEDDLRYAAQNSQFAIIIDGSESQGYAIEQIMSCDVPLLVWDVKSMFDNYNNSDAMSVRHTNLKLKATSVPYWDNNCGQLAYTKEDLYSKLELLLNTLDSYSPREYIVNALSPEKCLLTLLNLYKEYENKNI
jgi:hypothetical protein